MATSLKLQTACGLSDKYGMHNKDTCHGDMATSKQLRFDDRVETLTASKPNLSETLDQ